MYLRISLFSSLVLLASLADAAAQKPIFAVTIHPAAAIVREIAGDRAEVVRLLAPGMSPHTYSPKPSDMAAAESALVLVMVSPDLDGWAAKFQTKQRIVLMDLVPAEARLAAVDDDDHAEHDHGVGAVDPHFWTDPLTVKAILPALADRLATLDPDGKDMYHANAVRFAAELDALDKQVQELVAPIQGKSVVAFHPSIRYFLKRYGLVCAGCIEPFPGKEPTPRYLEGVIATLRKTGAKAVFTEPTLPRRPAEAVAEAAGIALGEIDVEGGQQGRQTYAELIRHNAHQLSDALK